MQFVLSLKSKGESSSILMSVIALLQNYQLWHFHQQSQCKETWTYKYTHPKHPYCGSGIPGNARIKVLMTSSFSSPGCVSGHRNHTVTAWFLCTFQGTEDHHKQLHGVVLCLHDPECLHPEHCTSYYYYNCLVFLVVFFLLRYSLLFCLVICKY